MAGDWIKMRGNLWDDPRVTRLCDLTDSSEAAIVGALYWLWATADQHSQDGVMPGLTLRAIDRKTGVQGFADALVSIGWLADHPEGVRLVRFEEHNGESAKRRASDAQRKANVRKTPDKTRTDDGQNADKMRRIAELEKRREEKRRDEDQKQKTLALPSFALPDWIPEGPWTGYLEMRKKKRKEPTARATELLIAELRKLKDSGQDISAVLDKSTVNGWTDVYPIKHEQQARASPPNSQLGIAGQATAANAQRLLEKWRQENEQAG